MTKPKVPESISAYLQEINLTIWNVSYGHIYQDEFGNPTQRPRADKTRVLVQLEGPGLDYGPRGEGPTVGDAVRAALANPHFRGLRKGLDGAIARLESAMLLLSCSIAVKNGGFSDDIPF